MRSRRRRRHNKIEFYICALNLIFFFSISRVTFLLSMVRGGGDGSDCHAFDSFIFRFVRMTSNLDRRNEEKKNNKLYANQSTGGFLSLSFTFWII